MKRLVAAFSAWSLLVLFGGSAINAADRPNILWISCEDISPNLGCYGDPHAITPNLDRLAGEGVRFTSAFTPAGVCAVVRSGIITGMYPPAIGSQHMRSQIIPPTDVKTFAELLRANGYFTTNRSKTDYQFQPTPAMWDRQGGRHQDWRERNDPKQPFFSVVNLTVCHESQIRHSESVHQRVIDRIGPSNRHDPDEVADTMPPYLADTPATRKNWAWYHDNITRMDQMAGEILDRLQADGLTDDTLVVFWSDHGMGMPRGKRWLNDTGIRIPLIMRWPGRIDSGTMRNDLVSVLDLAPTMLDVARVDAPQAMHGRILIGPRAGKEPDYLFFHRDRMDETYELQRAARDRRWKYIRNFQPERTYSQRIDYMDKMPAMIDWRRFAAAGKLSESQSRWFAPTKPMEELYDLEKDPWELTNLAGAPEYADRLTRMRKATERWQERIGDTGMIPEPVLMEEMKPSGQAPTTDPPEIAIEGESVSLSCATDGSSLVYRLGGGKNWSPWRLYVKSFSTSGTADSRRDDRPNQIQVQAWRLGFMPSPIVTASVGEK